VLLRSWDIPKAIGRVSVRVRDLFINVVFRLPQVGTRHCATKEEAPFERPRGLKPRGARQNSIFVVVLANGRYSRLKRGQQTNERWLTSENFNRSLVLLGEYSISNRQRGTTRIDFGSGFGVMCPTEPFWLG
jgi:hypothetical protein